MKKNDAELKKLYENPAFIVDNKPKLIEKQIIEKVENYLEWLNAI